MNKKVLIVIPYISNAAQGRELEMCIAGWRQHFLEPYKIAVIGDYHPICDSGDDVVYIPKERVEDKPNEYRCHLDFVSKFTAAREYFPDYEGFVFCCDDYYAVHDFDLTDIMVLKRIGTGTFSNTSPNAWQRNKAKTRELLKSEGYPIYNFTTHLPQFFYFDYILEMFETYNMKENSYCIEDMYFNIYYHDRLITQLNQESDIYKFGVYTRNITEQQLRDTLKNKIWVNNSKEGWSPMLEKVLCEHYNI